MSALHCFSNLASILGYDSADTPFLLSRVYVQSAFHRLVLCAQDCFESIDMKFSLHAFVVSMFLVTSGTSAFADENRAPAPKYSAEDTRGVFFDDLDSAFRGPRPTTATIRQSAAAAAAAAAAASSSDAQSSSQKSVWASLISPASIEDEIKRMKLHYDSVITTPGAFNSGGYQDARLDLTVLASLFAVIVEHGGEVRWKDQAVAARDLLARTAFNCKAGSTQVYNEAKLRKGDLQDLISGSGLSKRDAEALSLIHI